MAYAIATCINTSGDTALNPEELENVIEMRFNRLCTAYHLADRTMLLVSATGVASDQGDGRKAVLFPLTTVEELDDRLQWLRLRTSDRQTVVAAYLDFRFARRNGQYSTSRTVGTYSRSRLPRGGQKPGGLLAA
jgi:hypothetical protein